MFLFRISAVAVLVFALNVEGSGGSSKSKAPKSDHVSVKGYTTKSGKVVNPSVRSSANGNAYDNFSAKGHVNPATGKKGTENPYAPKKTRK